MYQSDNKVLNYKTLIAAISGNFIEWYDFALYLFLAPVLAKAFFPDTAGRLALLGTLTMHAISFFFRPLGAVIFGHLGDVRGRKVALQLSLSGLSILSICIALLPNYQHIGWLAPLLLCLCRIGQGICLGGEFAGSMVYLTESAPVNSKSLWSSMSNNGSNSGILMASISAAILSYWLDANQFASYGYRILFLVGGIIGVLGFALRSDIQETQAFESRTKHYKIPIATLFKTDKKRVVQLFFLLGISAVGSYAFMGSISTFLQQSLSLSLSTSLIYETGFITLSLILVPICAWISDRVTPQKMLQVTCMAYIVVTLPAFYLFYVFKQPLLLLPVLLMYSMEQASMPAFMSSLFPTELRYTAISLAYNCSMAVIGGLSPLLTQVHESSQTPSFSIAYLLLGSSCIALPLIYSPKLDFSLLPLGEGARRADEGISNT